MQFFFNNSHRDLPLEQIAILAAKDGAPEVFCDEEPAPVFISLSHSGGVAFCAAGSPGRPLGCDLEKIEPRSAAFIEDYFTENEQAAIAGKEGAALWANLVWSAKESALKALRSGLRMDPRKVEVEFTADTEKLRWHGLKVAALECGSVFHGYWRFSPEFVFTLVGGQPYARMANFDLKHTPLDP